MECWPLLCVVVISAVLAEQPELDKSHGLLDQIQLPSLQPSPSDGFHQFLQSPYAKQFTKFEQTDNKDKEVHHNVKTIIVTKKIPVPYTVQVERKVPYAIKVPIRRPYAIFVPKPYLVEIPKPVPYAVKVPVPHPFTVEKHVPVPYRVPVDKPFPINVPKPYPVILERKVPIAVEKPIPFQVKVPIEKPVAALVPVEKHVPFTVEKPVPVPIHVPEEKFPFQLDHHNTFPNHFDSTSEHAQISPYYAEYFQKHLSQTQGTSESQNKEFHPSPQEPTPPTLINQESKVLSFLPGSGQEHLSYYYPGTVSNGDVLLANSNYHPQKFEPAHSPGFQWPKPVAGDWTPKTSTTFTTLTADKTTPTASYSIDDGKTVYKFSLERNPEPMSHSSHTLVSESFQSKPNQPKVFLNQVVTSFPTKVDKQSNKKKYFNPDKPLTGSENMKPVYFDVTKQRTPFFNLEMTNSQSTPGTQKYAFFNPTYDKFDFTKAQALSNNFNTPKFSQHQVHEDHFDFASTQPLIQTMSTTQSTPYFQSLQQMHSYNPFNQNVSSSYQYAYPYQHLNGNNMFSLGHYPNLYSNKHVGYAYILPDSKKQNSFTTKEKSEGHGVIDTFSNFRFENPIRMPEERPEQKQEVITFSPLMLVSPQHQDISYQTQVPTPQIHVYDNGPKVNTIIPNLSQSIQETAHAEIKEIVHPVQAVSPSNQYETYEEPVSAFSVIQVPSQLSTRADSIFGTPVPKSEDRVKEKRKDKRRTNPVHKHHRKPPTYDPPVVTTSRATTPTTTSTQHTTVPEVTQPSIPVLKPQVQNPLEHQTYQTTSPQPEHFSRVEISKTFSHVPPMRMAYSLTSQHHKRTQDWKMKSEKQTNADEANKESKPRESLRRRVTRKPENHTELPRTTDVASTTASTIRTRGTRKMQRQKTEAVANRRSEITSSKVADEEPTPTRLGEINVGGDLMKIQTSTKIEHSSNLEPNGTSATSFTDITRTLPKKSRRRNVRKQNRQNENSTLTTTANYPSYVRSSNANYPSSATPTANYPFYVRSSSYANYPSSVTPTANYPSTSSNTITNYSTTVTYTSPISIYPSTSNYPSNNQPTPFQMTQSFTPTSVLISTPNRSQPFAQDIASNNV